MTLCYTYDEVFKAGIFSRFSRPIRNYTFLNTIFNRAYGFVVLFIYFKISIIFNTIFKYYLKHSNNYKDYLIYVLIYFAMSTWVNSGIDYPLRNGLILIPIFLFFKKMKFKQ